MYTGRALRGLMSENKPMRMVMNTVGSIMGAKILIYAGFCLEINVESIIKLQTNLFYFCYSTNHGIKS